MPRDDLYLLLRSAVLQKLTVIGEAARGLDRALRDRHAQVPWPRIIAFRNVAVHEYFAVEWPTVWQVAKVEVPDLRELVYAVLRQEFPGVAVRVQVETDE